MYAAREQHAVTVIAGEHWSTFVLQPHLSLPVSIAVTGLITTRKNEQPITSGKQSILTYTLADVHSTPAFHLYSPSHIWSRGSKPNEVVFEIMPQSCVKISPLYSVMPPITGKLWHGHDKTSHEQLLNSADVAHLVSNCHLALVADFHIYYR